MGTALAHMLRADAASDAPDSEATAPAAAWSPDQSTGSWGGPDQDQRMDRGSGPPTGIRRSPPREPGAGLRTARQEIDKARHIARRLTAEGRPVSRRALRNGGVKGSNETLNALARKVNAELAGAAPP